MSNITSLSLDSGNSWIGKLVNAIKAVKIFFTNYNLKETSNLNLNSPLNLKSNFDQSNSALALHDVNLSSTLSRTSKIDSSSTLNSISESNLTLKLNSTLKPKLSSKLNLISKPNLTSKLNSILKTNLHSAPKSSLNLKAKILLITSLVLGLETSIVGSAAAFQNPRYTYDVFSFEVPSYLEINDDKSQQDPLGVSKQIQFNDATYQNALVYLSFPDLFEIKTVISKGSVNNLRSFIAGFFGKSILSQFGSHIQIKIDDVNGSIYGVKYLSIHGVVSNRPIPYNEQLESPDFSTWQVKKDSSTGKQVVKRHVNMPDSTNTSISNSVNTMNSTSSENSENLSNGSNSNNSGNLTNLNSSMDSSSSLENSPNSSNSPKSTSPKGPFLLRINSFIIVKDKTVGVFLMAGDRSQEIYNTVFDSFEFVNKPKAPHNSSSTSKQSVQRKSL